MTAKRNGACFWFSRMFPASENQGMKRSAALAAGRLCLLVSAAVMLWGAIPAVGQSSDPVAVVGGEEISDTDLQNLVSGQLQQLRQQEYQIKAQALEELINQKLLEAAAARENVSPEDLLRREADDKVTAPTDAEIEAIYNAQKARINRPLEEVKPQIQQMVLQSRFEEARKAYYETLRAKVDIAIRLQPPRTEVSHDPDRVTGDPNAPITIVEFSDFQCPFCKRAYPVIKQLISKYPTQIKLSYRDFPLRQIHPQADAAAVAARCAGEQGKFWQYHDILFESNQPLNTLSFMSHATTLNLDTTQFDKCLSTGQFAESIESDLQDGSRAGVNGTPAFFINGIALTGAQPLEAFERVVEQELATIRRSQGQQ